MNSTTFEQSEQSFRPPQANLYSSIGVLTIFVVAGVGATYCAFFNIDGSFPNPIDAAICIAIFSLIWVLIACWATIFFARHKVSIDEQQVRIVGAFTITSLQLNQIQTVKWSKVGEGGRIDLESKNGRGTIHLDNFNKDDQKQITNLIRRLVPNDKHDNWERFNSSKYSFDQREPSKSVVIAVFAGLIISSLMIVFTSMVLLMIYPNFYSLFALVIAGALVAYVTHRIAFTNVKTVKRL